MLMVFFMLWLREIHKEKFPLDYVVNITEYNVTDVTAAYINVSSISPTSV